jgi:hypothetical protein
VSGMIKTFDQPEKMMSKTKTTAYFVATLLTYKKEFYNFDFEAPFKSAKKPIFSHS